MKLTEDQYKAITGVLKLWLSDDFTETIMEEIEAATC